MGNDFAAPSDLGHLPGSPFTDVQVDEAVAALRAAARWHIAPERVETGVALNVDPRTRALRLPTRLLVSVQQVRNADGEVIPATDYDVSPRGRIRLHDGYWPEGYGAVIVDFTHGYAATPLELMPTVAALALSSRVNPTVEREKAGGFEVVRGLSAIASRMAALEPYRLHKLGLG